MPRDHDGGETVRVLVTGHHGYIGSVLTPALVAAGHDVTGLDSDLFVACVHGPPPADVPSLRMDVRDVEPQHLTGFDAVVHLAALSNDPLGDVAPEQTYAINHAASVRLGRLARDRGVRRFLYSSSCSVYGVSGADELVDETAPLRPVSPYAISKIRAEEDLQALADDDFSPVYLRNATVYGWSPRLRSDLVVNDLTVRALLTGEVLVRSDGTPWRPVVHVADVAAAFVAALQAPRERVHDEAINVGSEDENYQVAALAEIVCATVSGSHVTITGQAGADPRSYRVGFSKLRRLLYGFQATRDVAAGAAEIRDACRRYGITDTDHRHRFNRLARLRDLRDTGVAREDLRVGTA